MLPSAPNVRIVKGAYLEPPALAFAQKRDVDENYVKLAELALSHDGYTAIATHDASIVARIEEFSAARGLPKRGRFEFQTLYGIAEALARGLVERGYRVRLSIPYGSFWFPYLMRRLGRTPRKRRVLTQERFRATMSVDTRNLGRGAHARYGGFSTRRGQSNPALPRVARKRLRRNQRSWDDGRGDVV